MELLLSLVAAICFGGAAAGSIADIEHVVLFMQENRAFDHYFGTMAGVRGFSDPNVAISNGRSVFYQKVDSSLSSKTDYLLPWYLNYLGGTWPDATQCLVGGDNGWSNNHGALNGDLNNMWALKNSPYSWGYFKRSDIPVHFGIAEGWTVGDMYQESVIASTCPNRASWISGSINAPGGPQTPDQGGTLIDNNETPGCEGKNLNCYPLKWKTAPEFYQDAGVTWQVYQDKDNFDDNPLAWFSQFQSASKNSELGSRGMSFIGLDKFYSDCAAGTLPKVSYIIGPMELSEHPPYLPRDGAWLQQQIVNAVVKSPAYNKTALIISYDETGGFGDHVVPYHSPMGTAAEWMKDPYGNSGNIYTGPGFRLPFYIISPWTRGGNVFVENADHVSQIKFIETWLAAKGYNVKSDQIPAWRREHMSDLTKAFDFNNPNYSLPTIPNAVAPSQNAQGTYNGYARCESSYFNTRPKVPYGTQTVADSLVSEQGFKAVRGDLTEGRFLVLEMAGYALTNNGGGSVSATRATARHEGKAQRWIAHQLVLGQRQFTISSAVDGSYIGEGIALVNNSTQAGVFSVQDLGNGGGYTLSKTGGYLQIGSGGQVGMQSNTAGFSVFSVT